MPIVVDFGGTGSRVLVTCVVAQIGETGAEVLQAQGALLGYPVPRYDSSGSGLLCAIDGYPTSGCGSVSDGHYAYWAYWHGGTQWKYADDGPAEWKVYKGDVEGWRFEPQGSATTSDLAPRAAASATRLEVAANATRSTLGTSGSQTTTSSSAPGSSSGTTAGPLKTASSTHDGSMSLRFGAGLSLIALLGAGALLRSRRDRAS